MAAARARFTDHLAGTAGIYTVELSGCPACGGAHAATLSRITGRFLYRCGTWELSGLVDGWPATRHRFEAQQCDSSGQGQPAHADAAGDRQAAGAAAVPRGTRSIAAPRVGATIPRAPARRGG